MSEPSTTSPSQPGAPAEAQTLAKPVSFGEAVKAWLRIGVLSFGGPTVQIAVMHRIVVEEKKWLSERQFLNALSFCMLLPGPEATQLATYAGWRLHGIAGGLAAGLLFVLPGALVMLALAMIYAAFGSVPFVDAVFFGIKSAVLVIVVEALIRIARRALKLSWHWGLAAAAFIGIFFLGLPFPLIVLAAAVIGFLHGQDGHEADLHAADPTPLVRWQQTLSTTLTWLAIWFLPLLALASALGPDDVLTNVGWFFSKLAVVTFGGAYAVLAYMAQDVVQHHGWLAAGDMMTGLGLAETTPGPLILVTEFVGYMAGYNHGFAPSWLAGVAGALVALWATFVPCFLWIFAGAPYVEWIIAQPRLRGALTAITAAVVGVILNLAVWFALHVFFGKVDLVEAGLVKLWTPELSSLDWRVVVLAAVSAVLLLWRQWGIAPVLAMASGLALLMRAAGI